MHINNADGTKKSQIVNQAAKNEKKSNRKKEEEINWKTNSYERKKDEDNFLVKFIRSFNNQV